MKFHWYVVWDKEIWKKFVKRVQRYKHLEFYFYDNLNAAIGLIVMKFGRFINTFNITLFIYVNLIGWKIAEILK